MECIKLYLGMDSEQVESLWVKIKGQAKVSDTIVSLHYRPPYQVEGF